MDTVPLRYKTVQNSIVAMQHKPSPLLRLVAAPFVSMIRATPALTPKEPVMIKRKGYLRGDRPITNAQLSIVWENVTVGFELTID
jgi:hypothetical protein